MQGYFTSLFLCFLFVNDQIFYYRILDAIILLIVDIGKG